MSHTEIVTLQYPFTHKGEEITELTIRRPKIRDMQKSSTIKDDMKKAIAMMADLAEIEPAAIGEMDPEDFNEANKVIAGFLGVSEEQIQNFAAQ
ncbi:phage tail assembly protein [Thalassobius sp. I31.1]|uniref:phage tail assembly protein n=1 Tax=Thalassobius sp. I31.1 TaxID=2109912 RepID=UPI000D19E378|nr:phage tail assembly protein [Thalassobius sp. I31.1]